jgi:DNA-binding winged helix-turn-helix (wHTH) protein
MSVSQSPSNQLQIAESALAMSCLPARYVRFGRFQLDAERQELFQDGQRVRMQAKVYQILLLLVSRAGDVVTREEVGKRLWPEHFLLSLDANVNTAMNKLRQGLGDSRENPMYVETIPRRGYCFIAALEFSDLALPAVVQPSQAANPTVAETVDSEVHRPQLRLTLAVALRIASLLLAGMVVGVLLTLAWFSFYSRNHKPLTSAEDVTSLPAASTRR